MLSKLEKLILPWYDENARKLPWRESPEPYHVWISEIMLQQTRVEAVKSYYKRFIAALPEITDLASVNEDELLKLWEGLGYYNRARNLQKAAKIVVEQFNGSLPTSYKELLSLPGIGEYTAGAIASIAFGESVPAVDGNVLRVITRVLASFDNISLPETKVDIRQRLTGVMSQNRPGDFNQALMELGATVCLPNGAPLCHVCPLNKICRAFLEGLTDRIPVKSSKKERKTEQRTILMIVSNDEVLLQKRPKKGLLAGMWEFLNLHGKLSLKQIEKELFALGFVPKNITKCGTGKHIFTHLEWHMQGYLVEIENKSNFLGVWAGRDELESKYALPSAFRIFTKQL